MISKEDLTGNITCVSVTDIGKNHKKLNIPNQDAVLYECMDEDFVLGVSDGVGSCSKAENGSLNAVEACREIFRAIKAGKIPFESEQILNFIIDSWKKLCDGETNEYCATLKAVIKKGNVMKVISIGDGFVAVVSDGINILSPLDEVDFANETKCLSDKVTQYDFWTFDFRLDLYKSYVVVACTDGIANNIQKGKEIELAVEIENNIVGSVLKTNLEELVEDIADYSFDDKTIGVVKYER